MTMIERTFREKIVLVGVITRGETLESVEESLDELALLVTTAGADVVERVVQRRDVLDPATFVGAGKAEEIRDISYQVDSDTVVFDDELSPAQQRNLEKIFGRTAIDRTAVILDIFAQNARTLEGKAQVELALLRYRLPRLRGRGQSLSQQSGQIGTRGPGETQLEVDRRRLMRRINKLERELVELGKTRQTQRKARGRTRQSTVSFVGYTNAGKSTLFNRVTEGGALTANKLFSTLDSLTRRAELHGGEAVLFSDTVGFVRKLPHQLVEAFRSTLDEVNDAELLLHIVDASAADPQAQIDAVHSVLNEIGTGEIAELMVFNKVDCLDDEGLAEMRTMMARYPNSVAVSARTGVGVDELVDHVANQLRTLRTVVTMRVPYARGDVMAALHRDGEILTQVDGDDASTVEVRLDSEVLGRLDEFVVRDKEQ
jgi:GTPase